MIRVVRYLIETEPLITIYAIMLLIMAILIIYKYIKVTVKKYKDEKIEELKNELKSDYYTFSYNVDNNQVTINIERYIIQ